MCVCAFERGRIYISAIELSSPTCVLMVYGKSGENYGYEYIGAGAQLVIIRAFNNDLRARKN